MATVSSVSYYTDGVELVLGENSTCSGDAEFAFMEAMNQDLELKIGMLSNEAPYLIQADLCRAAQNASRRVLSSTPASLLWYAKSRKTHDDHPLRR
jgi:hypothetical protein